MIRDLIHNIKGLAGIAPQVLTATTLSAACDLNGFEGGVARLHVGTFGDAQSGSVYIEAELQESADGITYTPCADSALDFPTGKAARTGTATGTFFQSKTTGAADAAGLYDIGLRNPYTRFVKVNVRLTGTHSTGTPISVSFVRSHPDAAPAQ